MRLDPVKAEEFRGKFLNFVNANDFFWTESMKRELNIVYSNVNVNPHEVLMYHLITKLTKKGLLGVSEVKGSHKQFYRLGRPIAITDLK